MKPAMFASTDFSPCVKSVGGEISREPPQQKVTKMLGGEFSRKQMLWTRRCNQIKLHSAENVSVYNSTCYNKEAMLTEPIKPTVFFFIFSITEKLMRKQRYRKTYSMSCELKHIKTEDTNTPNLQKIYQTKMTQTLHFRFTHPRFCAFPISLGKRDVFKKTYKNQRFLIVFQMWCLFRAPSFYRPGKFVQNHGAGPYD